MLPPLSGVQHDSNSSRLHRWRRGPYSSGWCVGWMRRGRDVWVIVCRAPDWWECNVKLVLLANFADELLILPIGERPEEWVGIEGLEDDQLGDS